MPLSAQLLQGTFKRCNSSSATYYSEVCVLLPKRKKKKILSQLLRHKTKVMTKTKISTYTQTKPNTGKHWKTVSSLTLGWHALPLLSQVIPVWSCSFCSRRIYSLPAKMDYITVANLSNHSFLKVCLFVCQFLKQNKIDYEGLWLPPFV